MIFEKHKNDHAQMSVRKNHKLTIKQKFYVQITGLKHKEWSSKCWKLQKILSFTE